MKRKKPKKRKHLPFDERYEIAKKLMVGVPAKVIASDCGISLSYISKIKYEFFYVRLIWKDVVSEAQGSFVVSFDRTPVLTLPRRRKTHQRPS